MREGARVAHSVEAVAFLVLATVRGGGRGGRSQNDCSFRGGVWYGGDSTDVTMMAVAVGGPVSEREKRRQLWTKSTERKSLVGTARNQPSYTPNTAAMSLLEGHRRVC